MADNRWSRGERGWALLVGVGVVGSALVPLRQFWRPLEQRVDSFPLSYYPMFSDPLGQHWRLEYAVGVRRDGTRFTMPYRMLGAGGVNQVRKQLFRAVLRGRAEQHARLLATRLAARPDCVDVVRVEIVCGEFDLDKFMMRRGTPANNETVLAGADLPHPEPGSETRSSETRSSETRSAETQSSETQGIDRVHPCGTPSRERTG